jgi:hypothetical protein
MIKDVINHNVPLGLRAQDIAVRFTLDANVAHVDGPPGAFRPDQEGDAPFARPSRLLDLGLGVESAGNGGRGEAACCGITCA